MWYSAHSQLGGMPPRPTRPLILDNAMTETTVNPLPAQRTSRHVMNVILRDPLALISTVVIILFSLLAVFAPLIAPYPKQGQGRTNAADTMLAPSAKYLLGTDRLGRDVLSRIIFGTRPALVVPMGVVLFAVLIGATRDIRSLSTKTARWGVVVNG